MRVGREGARTAARTGHRWLPVAVGAVAVAVGVVATTLHLPSFAHAPIGSPPPASQTAGGTAPSMAFGVLGSSCDPARARALHRAGVRYAEMGVDWSSFEPTKGSFDRGYQAEIAHAVENCRQAGVGVVLSLGLNSAPGWVSDLPAGAYVDQGGQHGPTDVPNVVFSAAVRQAVSSYLTELDRVLGLNSLAAIRVGTGVNGELGYPGAETPTRNPYWAFDAAAQNGSGLADGMSVDPMPGWNPGSPTWQGVAVSTAEVRNWFSWYSGSVADTVIWLVQQLRGLGYTHDIHLPLAGRGELPADLQQALAAHLDGTGQRDGSLESGLYYPAQLSRIARQLERAERPGWGAVSVDATSLDDSTAVAARQLDPPEDSCRPGDATRDLLDEPTAATWSSFRWTVANARAAGLGVVGENPGPPDAEGTGGDDRTDSSDQQLIRAPRYAQECGMTLFLWAFEDYLFGSDQDGLRAYADQQRVLEDRARQQSSAPSRTGDGG